MFSDQMMYILHSSVLKNVHGFNNFMDLMLQSSVAIQICEY